MKAAYSQAAVLLEAEGVVELAVDYLVVGVIGRVEWGEWRAYCSAADMLLVLSVDQHELVSLMLRLLTSVLMSIEDE